MNSLVNTEYECPVQYRHVFVYQLTTTYIALGRSATL